MRIVQKGRGECRCGGIVHFRVLDIQDQRPSHQSARGVNAVVTQGTSGGGVASELCGCSLRNITRISEQIASKTKVSMWLRPSWEISWKVAAMRTLPRTGILATTRQQPAMG